MTTVLLALTGALVYGCADFLGGLAARRMRPVVVSALAAVVGIVPLLGGVALLGARFSGSAVLWGALGGIAGGIGVLLLYAALAIGPMSVLSPLTAVASAVVPVAVALLRGVVLSPLAVVALVVAVVAVVLVAAVRDRSGARLTVRGVLTALVAGCGFGGLVLAYDATPPDSGVAPLLVARVLQAVLLGAAVFMVVRRTRPGGPPRPAASGRPDEVVVSGAPGGTVVRGPSTDATVPGGSGTPDDVTGSGALSEVSESDRVSTGRAGDGSRRGWSHRIGPIAWVVLACGVADAAANVCIQAALHASADPTTLPVVSVLNALYPVGTIVLAAVVL